MTKHGPKILIGGAVLLVAVVMLIYGGPVFFYGTHLFQKSSIAWNGLDIPIQAPTALPPGDGDRLLVLKIYKSDWSGLTDSTLSMRNVYDEALSASALAYCAKLVAGCKQETMTIAGMEFRSIAFSGQFESVRGHYHVHLFSKSPAITMQYHGDLSEYAHFRKVLEQIRKV